jgi:hypothetical protein
MEIHNKLVVDHQGQPIEVIIPWQEYQQIVEHLALKEKNVTPTFSHQQTLPKGTPGHQLLKFAGTIPPDDLQLMSEAIETDCRKVELNEW